MPCGENMSTDLSASDSSPVLATPPRLTNCPFCRDDQNWVRSERPPIGIVVCLFADSRLCCAGPVLERHPPGSPYSIAGSKTRFDRDALVLIINRDAEPIKEAHQP